MGILTIGSATRPYCVMKCLHSLVFGAFDQRIDDCPPPVKSHGYPRILPDDDIVVLILVVEKEIADLCIENRGNPREGGN